MANQKYTEEDIRKMLPEFIAIKSNSYISMDKKAIFIDKEYGEWSTRVRSVINGSVHPARSKINKLKKITTKIEDVVRLLPPHITIDPLTYINSKNNARFFDHEYGEFISNVGDVIRRGRGHPKRAHAETSKRRLLNPDDVQKRLDEFGCGIVMIKETYRGVDKQAVFIDREYGEFIARPAAVLRGGRHPDGRAARCKKTMMDRYGVEHNSHIPEVAKAMSRSATNLYTRIHWADGSEVICQGKLELAVVDYMNHHKIPYKWQIIFRMPTGKTYRIDLYLPKEDKYVEIKGYFRSLISLEKWEWFHKEHPNSELWTEGALRRLGIIISKKHKFWEIK